MVLQKSTKAAIAIAACLLSVFVCIALLVVQGETIGFDTAILQAINAQSTAWLNYSMTVIAHAGDIVVILALSFVLCSALYRMQKLPAIATVIAAVGGAIALNAGLKMLFQRDRPELWDLFAYESTFSFPSGHALITGAFVVTLVSMLWYTKWRYWALAIGGIYGFLVGFSRLYLGVHYPTDVLAGWCVGIAWALIVYVVVRKLSVEPTKS